MKKIMFCRCDDRLIHGQINYKWLEYFDIKKIVIIDDIIPNDVLEKGIIHLATPKNIKLDILTTEQGINYFNNSDDTEKEIVLVKKLNIVKELVKNGVQIEKLNIGRIPTDIGKRKLRKNIYVNEEELQIMNDLKNKNIKISFQITPDDEEEFF